MVSGGFNYTDSDENVQYEHMLYLVTIPLADLPADKVSLAFEYYGTASIGLTVNFNFMKGAEDLMGDISSIAISIL